MANGDLGTFLLGQRERDVRLPPELVEAGEARQAALRRLARIQAGEESPAVQALRAQGRRGGEDIERRARGQVAGARGGAGLLAARQAQAGAARGQQQLAGDVAQAVGQQLSQEQQAARALELQGLSDADRAALQAQELRRLSRRPGALDVLTTGLGALIGGAAGGGRGAAAGGQLGQAFGQAFERR